MANGNNYSLPIVVYTIRNNQYCMKQITRTIAAIVATLLLASCWAARDTTMYKCPARQWAEKHGGYATGFRH